MSLFCRLANLKQIATIHTDPKAPAVNYAFPLKIFIYLFHRFIILIVELLANKCVYVSNALMNQTSIYSKKSLVIHNWLSPRFYSIEKRNFRKCVTYLYVGSLIPSKGTKEVIEFFGKIHELDKNVILNIIGNGPVEYLTYLRKVIISNRLESSVFIRGYQDDIEKLKALLKEEKRRQDKMTFDELLENTCNLVKMSEQKMDDISWIIVDEVQDSDEKQLELIDCLKKPQTCFFAVGDPNQVIYSWRGSAFHIFYQLKTKYQATELTLPVNYRSSSEILAVARCFMQQGGTLQGGRESGDKIQIRNMYDPFQEADYLAGRIRDLHASGLPYREMAIFYRLQNQSEIFEHVFEKEGIPFEVSLKKTVKDIPVLDWLIRVLRFSVNPKDKSSGIACDGFCADIHIAEAGENPVKLDRCMDVCPKSESRFIPACQCTCQNIRGQGQG